MPKIKRGRVELIELAAYFLVILSLPLKRSQRISIPASEARPAPPGAARPGCRHGGWCGAAPNL